MYIIYINWDDGRHLSGRGWSRRGHNSCGRVNNGSSRSDDAFSRCRRVRPQIGGGHSGLLNNLLLGLLDQFLILFMVIVHLHTEIRYDDELW